MSNRFNEALDFNLDASNYLYALCDYGTILKKDIFLLDFINIVKKNMM